MLEVEKYQKAWSLPEYRLHSSGEDTVDEFIQTASPKLGDTVIDFGCGTGRAASKLRAYGLTVAAVDFAENCMDADVSVPFIKADITKHVPITSQWGYCTDVMEHLPSEDVPAALKTILHSSKVVYFKIATFDDVYHANMVGEKLHLTVEGYDWWKAKIESVGGKILTSKDGGMGSYVAFLVTAWEDASALMVNGKLNIDEETLRENIRVNSSKGYQLVKPHLQQNIEVMLLGGGPSMKAYEDDIRRKRESGMPLITTNGSYGWCIQRGILPSAQIIVDGREFNKRFLDPIIPECKYLLASQCHPSLFEFAPRDQVYLWHSVSTDENVKTVRSLSPEEVWPIPGGSTVILRAIPLLRLLGFPKFHIYGFDSCVYEGHHSYKQEENDKDLLLRVQVCGRDFLCAPWMISQAEEFKTLAPRLDPDAKLNVYGDGLIATILRKAAEISKD